MSDTNPITIAVADVPHGAMLVGEVLSAEPSIRRVTLWLFAPGVAPRGEGTTWKDIKKYRCWSKSLHPLGTFRRRTSNLQPGTYTLVAHHPAEPGAAFPGLMQVTTFRVLK